MTWAETPWSPATGLLAGRPADSWVLRVAVSGPALATVLFDA